MWTVLVKFKQIKCKASLLNAIISPRATSSFHHAQLYS